MIKNLIKILIIISCFGFVILSCGDESPTQFADLKFPEDGPISFDMHVQPFLRVRCSNIGCHHEQTAAGGRIMTDYFWLFGSRNPGFIIAGEPDKSLFNQVVEGKNQHLLILNLVLPTENQQQGIRRWVEDGALLN